MWNRIKNNIDSGRPLFEGNEEQHLILAILIYFVAKDALKFFCDQEQNPKVVYVLEKDKEQKQPPYYLQPVKTEDGQTLYKLLSVK